MKTKRSGKRSLGGEGPQTAGHSQFGSGQPGREPPPQLSGAVLSLPPGAGRDLPLAGPGRHLPLSDRGKATCKGKNRESPPEKEISGFAFPWVSRRRRSGGGRAVVG